MTSRRRIHADARTALAVRTVQQGAALMRLQVQRQAEDAARADREARLRQRTESEAGWAAAVGQGRFDPTAEGLWRERAHRSVEAARQAEAALQGQAEASEARLDDWRSAQRRQDAAARVETTARRRLERQAEAARLDRAEDAGHATRARP